MSALTHSTGETRRPKRTLVIELQDGGTRRYKVAASRAEARLADHHAMVAAFGTGHLYKRAYLA